LNPWFLCNINAKKTRNKSKRERKRIEDIKEDVTAGSMQWSKAQSLKNLIYWKILSYGTK
jgi:hypothetical protein